jgi:hypothetical protein
MWGYVLPIDRYQGTYPMITSVSCASQTFCVAVDNAGNVLMFKGRAWSRPVNIDTNTYGFTSVSCATTKFCVAVDAEGYESTWNGRRWVTTGEIDTSGATYPSVSCPTVNFCAAVDQFGNAAHWNGTKWTAMPFPAGVDVQALSCVSSSFCVTGDVDGDSYTWDGQSWAGPHQIDRTGGIIRAVSCVKGPFCLAAGADAETFNGSSWTSHGPIAPLDLESAACASSRFCIVGDAVGDAYLWNGGRFSHQGMIDPENTISGLSCRSTSFCSGVDSGGNGLFWARRPLITTVKLPTATKSHRYVASFAAKGALAGPYTWHRVAGGLARGLTLSPKGEISGTPKTAGAFRFIVRVTDPLGQHSQRHFDIKVKS